MPMTAAAEDDDEQRVVAAVEEEDLGKGLLNIAAVETVAASGGATKENQQEQA